MLGAKIGAGLGGMAGSFVGGDQKFATNYVNPEELMMGIQDTAGSIAGAVTLKSQKKSMGDLSNLMVAKRGSMSSQDIAWIIGQINTGDIESAIKYLEGING